MHAGAYTIVTAVLSQHADTRYDIGIKAPDPKGKTLSPAHDSVGTT
jgi:hypothetical protein